MRRNLANDLILGPDPRLRAAGHFGRQDGILGRSTSTRRFHLAYNVRRDAMDPETDRSVGAMRKPRMVGKSRVLIVEDDALIGRVWHEIFTRRGWDVSAVGTVAGALAALDPAPDYLILDLSLPDGSGETILRKIREDQLKTRVTVMTGSSSSALLARVKQLNPDALFEKPIDVADIWREGLLAEPA
jgi:CheY-like chemotaxis protein